MLGKRKIEWITKRGKGMIVDKKVLSQEKLVCFARALF